MHFELSIVPSHGVIQNSFSGNGNEAMQITDTSGDMTEKPHTPAVQAGGLILPLQGCSLLFWNFTSTGIKMCAVEQLVAEIGKNLNRTAI